jgi:hypothetical protein
MGMRKVVPDLVILHSGRIRSLEVALQGQTAVIDMVEHAELHGFFPPDATSQSLSRTSADRSGKSHAAGNAPSCLDLSQLIKGSASDAPPQAHPRRFIFMASGERPYPSRFAAAVMCARMASAEARASRFMRASWIAECSAMFSAMRLLAKRF